MTDMTEQLNCIMLIDDNKVDNFFHERVIKKNNTAKEIIIKESAEEALEYLCKRKETGNIRPDVIFLDINMPGMNGWEFIEEYRKLDEELQCGMVVVMLTTSENPDDVEKARIQGILADFKTKPLTKEMLDEVIGKFRNK